MRTYPTKLILTLKRNKILIIFILSSMILSTIAHWSWLREDTWSWRPAQTLLTTYWFKQEGISFISYQTPVYGPPWQVPFEFPLYQAVSSVVSNLLSIGIKAASHITSMLIFFTSAILLFLICYEYFSSTFTASVIFSVYVWFPFTFFYSNEILIDFMALTFALGFIYLVMHWFTKPKNITVVLLAIISLSLGSLVKITTIPIIVLPFLLLLVRYLRNEGFELNNIFIFLKTHKTVMVSLISMVLIPLILTYLWTNHADQIKLANPSTVWLTSSSLEVWNFGTLSQKLDLQNWWTFLKNIKNHFFVGASGLFFLISLGLSIKAPSKVREIIISCILGSFLTIFIFFNLYNQPQYYIAITAFMSILIGYGLSWFILFIQKQNNIWFTFLSIALFGFLVEYPGIERFKEYRQVVDFYHANSGVVFNSIARIARKNTPTNGYVISIQTDWSPELALPLERKVFILNGRNSELFNCDVINGWNYTTVIGPPEDPLTKKALACFSHHKYVDLNVFIVTNSP